MNHVQTKPKTTIILKANPAFQLEKAVAKCIIADQGRGPYPPRIEPYWKAFKSEFAPGMLFTLHSPSVNKVFLYVYEKNFKAMGSPRKLFFDNCGIIVSRLGEIAKAAERLGEKGCVEFEFRGAKKTPLPLDHEENWRCYKNILANEQEPFCYLMSVDITPLPKLYQI
jgi:hypothetical protein